METLKYLSRTRDFSPVCSGVAEQLRWPSQKPLAPRPAVPRHLQRHTTTGLTQLTHNQRTLRRRLMAWHSKWPGNMLQEAARPAVCSPCRGHQTAFSSSFLHGACWLSSVPAHVGKSLSISIRSPGWEEAVCYTTCFGLWRLTWPARPDCLFLPEVSLRLYAMGSRHTILSPLGCVSGVRGESFKELYHGTAVHQDSKISQQLLFIHLRNGAALLRKQSTHRSTLL